VVRDVLVARQRQWVVERGGAVVEGRDIGTVVFPDARLKVFVTASARVRAERRVREIGGDVDEVERAIVARDRRDAEREHSPLAEARDAVVVDTTELSIDAVVDAVVGLLADVGGGVGR
jgi:cytidylate kinase